MTQPYVHLRQIGTPAGKPQSGGNLLYVKGDNKLYLKDADGTEHPVDTGGALSLPFYFPEDYGAVGDGTTDDTVALQACIDAAATDKGGVCWFLGRYGWTGDLKIKGGVTVVGAGGPQIGSPAGSELGLKALGSTARVIWGQLNDGTGSMNDNPGPLMNLCIDGQTVGGATELLRCEAVETSMFNVHVLNGAGDGVNWTQSQNINVYNPVIGGFPAGVCYLFKQGASGLQPPGHIITYGGHIGDSLLPIKVTSVDSAFFVGPHDNMFFGTIFETGRLAGNITALGVFEDGDTHFNGCTFTIGSSVTAISENASLVVRNAIRTLTPTTLTLNDCSIGGGTGTVKAAHAVRNEGAAGRVFNQIIFNTRTAVANVTYLHCNDGSDGFISLDGPIVHITALTGDFTTINGGTLAGVVRNTQVPTRYSFITGTSNPLQIRLDGDTTNRLQIGGTGLMQWLNGSDSTVRASITRNGARDGLDITGETFLQLRSYTTATRPSAASCSGAVIIDATLGLPIWSTGTVWKDFAGNTV